LTPPWEDIRMLSDDGLVDGGRTVIEVAVGPAHTQWISIHKDVQPGRRFVDEQVEGPFKTFVHHHIFAPIDEQRSELREEIEYRLPLGGLGRLLGGSAVARRLERMFAYRHALLSDDLRRETELGLRTLGPQKIAITGASGLVGRALTCLLTTAGHEVRAIVRHEGRGSDIAWNPDAGTIERDKLVGLDAVVHLAGENIGDGRWSAAKKERIVQSRVRGTKLIAETLAGLQGGPRTLVSASAIGYYGSRTTPVDESAEVGSGFLAEVCHAWETAADPARAAGLRVVHPRTGIVLTPAGGALAPMVAAFKTGLGGRIGAGEQGMSWVAMDDLLAALHAMIIRSDLSGPVNVTAPEPLDQATFARVLGEVLGRPSVVPLPATAVRLALGERGERLLLEGAIVEPKRLVGAGHRFSYPSLAGALRHLLGLHDGVVAA
jgi:uncharacterized protein (TIGR01777 family)